jgi:hypothetical protein
MRLKVWGLGQEYIIGGIVSLLYSCIYYTWFWLKYGPYINKIKRNYKSKNFKLPSTHYIAQLMWRSCQSYIIVSCVKIVVWSECFPAFNFIKICFPRSKGYPQSKVKIMVIFLSPKGHIMYISGKWKFRFVEKKACL